MIYSAYQHQAEPINKLELEHGAFQDHRPVPNYRKYLKEDEMKFEQKVIIRYGLTIILYLLFSVLLSNAQATSVGIPKAIKIILDRNYPGWEMGAVSNEVDKFFKENNFKFLPVLVSGDFDGDGRNDYGIKINFKGKWHAIVFLARGGDYKEYILAGGTGPGLDVYLSLYKKGEKGFNFETDKYFFFKNDAIEVGFFEKASIAYVYKDGGFDKVFTSD